MKNKILGMINDSIEHDVCWDKAFHRSPVRGDLKINIKERTFSIKTYENFPNFDFYKILLCIILDLRNIHKTPTIFEKKDDGENISLIYSEWGYDSNGKSKVVIAADGSYEISEIETPSNFSI